MRCVEKIKERVVTKENFGKLEKTEVEKAKQDEEASESNGLGSEKDLPTVELSISKIIKEWNRPVVETTKEKQMPNETPTKLAKQTEDTSESKG